MKSMLTLVLVLALCGGAFWFLTLGEESTIVVPAPNSGATASDPVLPKPATPDPIASDGVTAARYAGESSTEETAPKDPTARGVVTARVVDESGRPVVGCSASATPNGGWGGPGAAPAPSPSPVKSDAEGRITLPGFRIGSRYSLRIDHPKFLDAVADVLVPGDAPFDVGKIVLKPGAMLTGVVVGEDGKGVAKASVRASSGGATSGNGPVMIGFGGGRSERAKVTSTDSEGRWTLGGIADGPVKVTATSSQHMPAAGVAATAKIGQTVEVPAIRLEAGLKISGRVLDHAGAPVAGAVVSVTAKPKKTETPEGSVEAAAPVFITFRTPGGEGEPIQLGEGPGARKSATTAADGSFTIAGLKEGAWSLRARRFGHASARVEAQAGTSALDVKLGKGAVIVGHVVDADGNPVADARIKVSSGMQVFGPTPDAGGGVPDVLRGAAAAALSGMVEAPNLIAVGVGEGTTMIEATAKGGATTLFPVEGMKSGEIRQLEFRLLPESLVEGVVRDDRGEGIVGVELVLDTPENFGAVASVDDNESRRTTMRRARTDGMPVAKAVSGAGGRFEITGVADGTWSLRARKDGYVETTVSVTTAPRTKTSVDIACVRTGTVEGVVTAGDGVERSGRMLTLTARGKQSSPGSFDPWREAPRAVSDAAGRFVFSNVAPGDWGLEFVRKENGGGGFVSIGMVGGEETETPPKGMPVLVKSGETTRVEIAVPKPARVVGIVTDAGAPVAGIRVELARAGQPFFGMGNTRVTDASGRFEFDDVETGSWLVKAQPKGAPEPAEASVDVVDGAEVDVRLVLPGAVIEGVVRDSAGAPVAGAKVVASRKREGGTRTAVVGIASVSTDAEDGAEMITFDSTNPVYTGADGSYRIPYVAAGVWNLKVTSKQYRPVEKDGIDVTDGRIVKVDLVTEVGGQCLITCEGGPFDHVSIRVLDASREELGEAMGRNGPFSVRGLPPGTHDYEVSAFRAGITHVARGKIEIKAGETTRLTVTPKAE